MLMMRRACDFVVLAVVLAVSSTEAKIIEFDSCGSIIRPIIGKVLQIDITPCDSEPCVFRVGANVTAKITFIPEETVQDGLIELVAIFSRGERLPWPLKNPFACEDHNLNCPLKPKEPATAIIQTRVIEDIPGSYKLVAQVYMAETKLENYVFCFRIPVQVTY
ncbi:NPC intracellular cholesterol transporter 2-like [Actinia tenebrosa]|uniref:NPC intracellular cholesterol transporter 2-like n=1 Tax=Actinia tenebrosa TaxID=6105 RepID=A0A6P8IVR6_ACTTE|nr:NPC intracellular cholesterol transporter 2-like [Actinia tenebrosa]